MVNDQVVKAEDVIPVHSRISAGPILAGAILALATYLLLTLLGTALGLSIHGRVSDKGLAIGAAWVSGSDVGVFVVVAIALQNVPEGMVTALPLTESGMSGPRVFWAAVATSAPQVPGALLAYWAVTAAGRLLGFSFGLAAGAMLALVLLEIGPAAATRPRAGATGAALGALALLLLGAAIET